MTTVDPNAVLDIIANSVVTGYDATNEVNYLVNQGVTEEKINQQIIPLVVQKTAGTIFAENANLGDRGDYQKGIDFLKQQGISDENIIKDIQSKYDMFQTQYQEGVADRNKQQGGFLGFVERALPGLALGIISGGVGSLVTGAASTTAVATSIGNSLGVTGAGATTVGAAVLGSASSSVLAAVTGGDVVKSAITGAITSGAGANASDIGTSIAGGADNVKAIADALDLTTKQVTTAISNAVTSGVVSAVVTNTDVTTAVTSTLASSVVGSYTDNLVANIPDLKDSATLISNVAKVATKAAVSGTDVGDALVNSIPSIIGGLVDDPKATGTKLKKEIVAEVADETKTETASTLEIGDTLELDTPAGTLVTLADGSIGKVSPSGVIEASDATSDTTNVVFKEPTGTGADTSRVVISGVVMEDADSPSGFSDDEGNPINQDGTPYLDPNAVDVAPDNVNITTPTTDQEILDLINPVVVRDDAVATGTTGVTSTVDRNIYPTATTTATTTADTTGTRGGGTDTGGVSTTTGGVDTGVASTTLGGGGTGTDISGTGVDTGGGFRGTTTDTTTTATDPNQAILDLIATTTPTTNVVTTADPTAEPLVVTGTRDTEVEPLVVEGTTPERDFDYVEEEVKPYTPFEEDFPLQTDEEKLRISPTVIPKRPSQPSRTTKNTRLSTGLGIDTNVAALLGTGLPSRPDVSSTSEPYLLGKDDKRKDVWNTESLRGALGI
jgi:hypothetical protein